MSLRYKTAIVGASETTQLGVIPDVSETQLHIDAAMNAMQDAGIDASQIDGISATMSPATLAHYLGIVPTWVDNTQVGGTSFLIHMRHAAAAIASGLATTILCCMGQSGRSRVGVGGTRIGTAGPPSGPMYDGSYPGQFESIYGVLGPTTQFGMGVLRFMKDTGTTIEQLASVAVAQRKWSNKVPRAMFRQLVTVDDVLNSRMICYPYRLFMCCPVTDGGGAFILTSADRVDDYPTKPVYILGTGESVETPLVSQMYDITTSGGVQDLQREGVRGGRRIPRRHRPHPDLRRLRASADLRTGGPGLCGSGRGWGLCRGGQHLSRREAADEHQWRRAVLHPHGHVRHVRDAGVGAAGPRRGRSPGRGGQDVVLSGRRGYVHGGWEPHLYERGAGWLEFGTRRRQYRHH